MRPGFAFFCLATIQLVGGGACSNSGPERGGSGGQGSGGSTATGGSVNPSGGTTASGGTTSSGGVVGSGGTSANGGTTSSGGTIGSGGTAGSGGTTSSGGTSASGGSIGSGGSSVKGTGGVMGKGGTTGSGGATGKGGATGSGGNTSTGTCPTDAETKFSFFLTSYAGLQLDSKTTDGYGGDLGGLAGADAICQRIAERSSACQKNKTWHAFLSTPTVNARDRIGKGPWYDRLGRLLATNLDNLMTERPTGADAAIANDLPNENGIPNHDPDKTGPVDNHEILTGTGVDGKVYTQNATGGGTGGTGGFPFPGMDGTACGPAGETWSVEKATCWGWTNKEAKGCPRVGHSWPRQGSGIGWISVWNEAGCFPGGTLLESGFDTSKRNVGSNGGYGGYYCFAVTGS